MPKERFLGKVASKIQIYLHWTVMARYDHNMAGLESGENSSGLTLKK